MKLATVAALLSLSLTALAGDTTLCGWFDKTEENFLGPERATLDVRGKGIITLEFPGIIPYYNQGNKYCCFGDFSAPRKLLRVKTGCTEQRW